MKIWYNKFVQCSVSEKLVRLAVKIAEKRVKAIKGEVEINVVGEKEIKRLNARYRKINKVTDVLSFAWREDKKIKGENLGQIYICYPRVQKQAREYGVPVKEEFLRMIIHGLLHLAGYEHDTLRKEKETIGLQEKILGIVK